MATTTMRGGSRGDGERSWAPRGLDDTTVVILLAVAMVVSATLGLWFSRDTTYTLDELNWFSTSPHLGLRDALEPYNGHLILVTRVVYSALLHAFGAGYLAFRLLTIGAVLLTAGMFFVCARRRIGALAALAPTLILLFYGAGSETVLSGNGFTWQIALAAGISALLALERQDRAGDVGACLLLCLALASYSVGIPFLAGAAVLILIGTEGRRRAWIFLIPALLYLIWLWWAHEVGGSNTETRITLGNLLLAPNWGFDNLAAVGAAFVGLAYDFKNGDAQLDTAWGPIVAAIALVALGWRLSRGSIPRWLWAAMAVPLVFWVMGAAAEQAAVSGPESSRYIFPGTIVVLLVAVEAARGVRLARRGTLILYALAAISLSTNIALLRDNSTVYRVNATTTRADLAAVETATGRVGPQFSGDLVGGVLRATGEDGVATGYVEAARQFGSPAFSLPGLRGQTEAARDEADSVLADSLGLVLAPSSAPARNCRRISGEPGAGTTFRLPPRRLVLTTNGAPAPLFLRRFGSAFTVRAGQLAPGRSSRLSVPRDAAPDPWYASTPASEVALCSQAGR